MARTDPQINIRISALLKSRLDLAAAENGRSLTAEIAHRLEQSFNRLQEGSAPQSHQEPLFPDDMKALNDAFLERIKVMDRAVSELVQQRELIERQAADIALGGMTDKQIAAMVKTTGHDAMVEAVGRWQEKNETPLRQAAQKLASNAGKKKRTEST